MQNNNKQILVKVQGATLHQTLKSKKKKIDYGCCQIYRENQQIFFKIKYFFFNLQNMSFAKMIYKSSISYYFLQGIHQDKVLVLSISTQKNTQQIIKQYQRKLKQIAQVLEISNWQNNSELYKKIQQAWPQFDKKHIQSNGSALQKIAKDVGGFVGAVSGLVNKPLQNVGQSVGTVKQTIYQSQVKDQTKNKWQLVKKKAQKLNENVSKTFKPVNEGIQNITHSIGHSFTHSDNKIIKAIRDFGLKTRNSFNEGYYQGMGQKKQNIQLAQQSQTGIQQKK